MKTHSLALSACLLGLVAAGGAHAQFQHLPAARPDAFNRTSVAETPLEYRNDGARHIYGAYPEHVYKGRMPPLLYGIAIIETEIDASGKVLSVNMVRKPAAPEVGPWVMEMVRRSGDFPPPAKMGKVKYLDIWLVHKSGKFQLDTLTEGQN
jgi:periplasmic protein TonB